ncbi:MAG: cysteine desulfurase family protein [Flavipsychrobacter sp.]
MQRIYFDNAATTSLSPDVLEAMMPYLTEKFGNPSSIYSYGRETKIAVETARKTVAKILGAHPSEIFFTSGGTESSNTAINCAVKDLGCKHVISTGIEHHATLYNVERLGATDQAKVSLVKLLDNGHVDLAHLEELLASNEKTLVTLMHANNEIGNLLNIEAVGDLCEKYNAILHCDMVQTIGHYPINFDSLKVHFASASGHKFHGPKGAGILYINADISIKPLLVGGAQERNMRAGTENLYGIIGFAKALEIATKNHDADKAYILDLKQYAIEQIKANFPNARLNGDAEGNCLYTVLSVAFPASEKTEMLMMNLDMAGICVSGGSACSSGASTVSHVIQSLYGAEADQLAPVRISFCKHNTKEEVDIFINKLKDLL